MKKFFLSYRFFICFSVVLLSVGWTILSSTIELPSLREKPRFYANQCDDDLRRLYLKAIDQARDSIILIIYSMTDRYIINKLKKRAEEGVRVIVVHDSKTKQYGFNSLGNKIMRYAKDGSGLMHQKILIIDESYVYLGSANLTTSSLKVHDNLVMGCYSKELAREILNHHPYLSPEHPSREKESKTEIPIRGQMTEFFSFPEEGKEGVECLIKYLNLAKTSIKVAMFTWTHPQLTEAIIQAHQRGIDVEIVVDRNQGMGVNKKSVEKLFHAHVPIFFSRSELCHHKMALIDDSLAILGSANWTMAAFARNDDCFLVVHDLSHQQKVKLNKMWKVISCTRDPISITKEKEILIGYLVEEEILLSAA